MCSSPLNKIKKKGSSILTSRLFKRLFSKSNNAFELRRLKKSVSIFTDHAYKLMCPVFPTFPASAGLQPPVRWQGWPNCGLGCRCPRHGPGNISGPRASLQNLALQIWARPQGISFHSFYPTRIEQKGAGDISIWETSARFDEFWIYKVCY